MVIDGRAGTAGSQDYTTAQTPVVRLLNAPATAWCVLCGVVLTRGCCYYSSLRLVRGWLWGSHHGPGSTTGSCSLLGLKSGFLGMLTTDSEHYREFTTLQIWNDTKLKLLDQAHKDTDSQIESSSMVAQAPAFCLENRIKSGDIYAFGSNKAPKIPSKNSVWTAPAVIRPQVQIKAPSRSQNAPAVLYGL